MRFRLTLTPYLIYFLLIIFAFSSCKKTLEEERTFNEYRSIESYISKYFSTKKDTVEDGIYHVINEPSYGYQVSKGDVITFWYIGRTLDNIIFDTNVDSVAIKAKLDVLYRSFEPLVTVAGEGTLVNGLDDGMLYVREGEHATIIFPSSFGFGGDIIGPVKQWSPLAYEILLIKVDGTEIQKEKSYINSLNLASSGYSQDTSGLFYKYVNLGTNNTPVASDKIYGWYKGTLADGTVIEDKGNQQIILSKSNMPEGVKLGFMLTKNGGTTDLVLPSYLGYGNLGSLTLQVEPYQTIFYQIRIDSIK